MKLAVCIDNGGGMIFNHRRQSRDRELIRDLAEHLGGARLYAEAFSETILADVPHTVITREQAKDLGENDVFFVECPPVAPLLSCADTLIIYHWNRSYPSDETLDVPLVGLTLVSTVDFVGSSHEKITKEVYRL